MPDIFATAVIVHSHQWKAVVKRLDLTVRYFQDSPPEGQPYREEFFIRRELEMTLPVAQTGLVLVDMWDNHFIESWLERAIEVTRTAVVPVLEAARAAGLTIVHAPSPEVAAQFEQLSRHQPPPEEPEPDWPPPAFRSREGEFAAYRGPRKQPPGIPPIESLGMSPAITVAAEDFVIATGQQLHDLCREKKILHLLYAGFATNWCVVGRDYGLRAMRRRSYNLILLRDATTGVEFPDTIASLTATELAIREAEQQLGFSASNENFFSACNGARGD